MKQVVCAAIGDSPGRVLMARRATGEHLEGFWELPGGKVEPGETLASALERELEEELGLRAVAGAEIARTIHHYERGSIELIALATTVANKVGALLVHDAVTWVSAGEARLLQIAPADVPLINVVLQGMRA
ncbi:MAG: NUDIX domain-containing protein [Pseudomonadota bacterium]|nr:NUDIX domain-containing protein [Pseudomonadota bacterium]